MQIQHEAINITQWATYKQVSKAVKDKTNKNRMKSIT